MSESKKHGMIESIEHCIDLLAGETVRKTVMEGSDKITEKTDKKKIAMFVKTAMERLDATVNEETRFRIMENCGYVCAKINRRAVERFVARRKKFDTLDEFLEAEQRKPATGTRLERHGEIVYQFYTPQSYTRPVRCYCGLLSGLPADEKVSLTYCYCSKGFVEKVWEAILGKPVKVDLLQSVVSGAQECKFAIYLG
jgi:predicted hydrocarbon binding protein